MTASDPLGARSSTGPTPDGPTPDGPTPDGPTPDGPTPDGPTPDGDLHGRPTVEELLDATVAFLRDQLSPQIEGPMRHQVRIAVHALEVVAREMALGPEQSAAHAARLTELGFTTDAALANAIHDGSVEDTPLLRRLLAEDTRDRLLVANPRWLPDSVPT